jgi:tetratricopeptide (TPR) repeat protein
MGVYHLLVHEDPAAALPFFEQSVKIFPYFYEGHYNLANCAVKTLDLKKAVQSFRAARRYGADDPGVAKRAEEQLHFLESLVCKDGNFATLDDFLANQACFEEAFAAMTRRDYKQAEAGFLNVLKGNPRHVQSHGNLGLVYAGLGQKTEALACLDRALALDPNYEPARFNRRAIEAMTEGQPLVALSQEMQYYAEKAAREQTPRQAGAAGEGGPPAPARRSLWQRLMRE